MSGAFTTWTFWIGAGWGASVAAVSLWYWLIKPLGDLLGLSKEVP